MSEIYIIGHKSPDLDSVAAAISYADFKNKLGDGNTYKPAVAGEINKETKYILDKFGFNIPEQLNDLANKKVILVDHNENSQSADGIEDAEILGILDHHKLNFSYDLPITVKTLPWGSSCSIIAREFSDNGIEIDKNLASLMLAAILVDTVITKSPTCTDIDKEIIEDISKTAGISNWEEYGLEIFKVRGSINNSSAREIITSDAKEFNFKAGTFFINQVETVNLEEFKEREEELIEEMRKLKEEKSYFSILTFITDIMKEGSKLLVVTDDKEGMEKAFGKSLDEEIYLEGVVSRKKQVTPKLSEVFDK